MARNSGFSTMLKAWKFHEQHTDDQIQTHLIIGDYPGHNSLDKSFKIKCNVGSSCTQASCHCTNSRSLYSQLTYGGIDSDTKFHAS
jgi:hypothetical protein